MKTLEDRRGGALKKQSDGVSRAQEGCSFHAFVIPLARSLMASAATVPGSETPSCEEDDEKCCKNGPNPLKRKRPCH